MYQEPYLTALKIAIGLRRTSKNKGRLTSKSFSNLIKNRDVTPSYFVRVKEISEELGIGLYPLYTGGYLVIDIWAITKGEPLHVDDLFLANEDVSLSQLEYQLRDLGSELYASHKHVKKQTEDNLIEKLWFELITHAEQQTTVTYKDLGLSLGLMHHKKLEKPLRLIQSICQQYDYPSLSGLVVNAVTQRPSGLNVSSNDEWQQVLAKAYEFDWSQSLDVVDFEKYL